MDEQGKSADEEFPVRPGELVCYLSENTAVYGVVKPFDGRDREQGRILDTPPRPSVKFAVDGVTISRECVTVERVEYPLIERRGGIAYVIDVRDIYTGRNRDEIIGK